MHARHLLTVLAPLCLGAQAPAADPPGTGVVCLWAITAAIAEVARRCPVAHDTAFDRALEEGLATLDRHVAVNGPATPDQIARFKRDQGGADRSDADLCSRDAIALYDATHAAGAGKFRATVAAATARAGTPRWGDCL